MEEGSASVVVVVVVMPLLDGGSVEGIGLYVYGSVAAVGRLTKGDTVRGIWARRGCVRLSCMVSLIYEGN